MKSLPLTLLLAVTAQVFLPLSMFASRTVRVGIYQNMPKAFLDRNGKPKGLFIDILEYSARKENWRLRYVPGSWSQCLERLQNNKIDLLVDVPCSKARKEIFAFNKIPVLANWSTVYTKDGAGITTVLDLDGKRLAVVKGDSSYEELADELKDFGVTCEFVGVDGFREVLESIEENKTDAGLVCRLFGLRHAEKHSVSESPVICCPAQFYFAADSGKNLDLLQKIDGHLTEMKKNRHSLYYRSIAKWIEPGTTRQWPGWAKWLLSVTAATATLLAVSGLILKARLNRRTSELARTNEKLRNEIAERAKVEENLRHNERRFKGIFDKAFGFLGLLDQHGTVLEINRQALKFLGLKRAQCVGRTLWDMPWPGNSPGAGETLKSAVEESANGHFVRYETEVRGSKHTARTIDLSIKPVKDEDGNVALLILEGRDISRIKRSRQKLLAYQKELRALALKLSVVEEQERKTLATNLHDSVIQTISLARIKLGTMDEVLTQKEPKLLLDEIRGILNKALFQMRTLTFELSPPVLYELGLGAAFEWLGEKLQNVGISFEFRDRKEPVNMAHVVSILLFQSVRELLVNVQKHSRAKCVKLSMLSGTEDVTVTVNDNGIGFDQDSASGRHPVTRSFGLFSIRERMRHMGGSFEITSAPGSGTTAILKCPLKFDEQSGIDRKG